MRKGAIIILFCLPAYTYAGEWNIFMEVGIEYAKRPTSSYLRGRNPLFNGRIGIEYDSGLIIYYRHVSSIPDGPPVNNNQDQKWQESIGVSYKYTFGAK